jgi:hypothetical protein
MISPYILYPITTHHDHPLFPHVSPMYGAFSNGFSKPFPSTEAFPGRPLREAKVGIQAPGKTIQAGETVMEAGRYHGGIPWGDTREDTMDDIAIFSFRKPGCFHDVKADFEGQKAGVFKEVAGGFLRLDILRWVTSSRAKPSSCLPSSQR